MILTYRIRAAIGSAPQPQPTASFDDPRVQRVYKILCSEDSPPDGEHWEGYTARRIVDALSEPTKAQLDAVAAVLFDLYCAEGPRAWAAADAVLRAALAARE